MRLAITGANGFVGRQLCPYLQQQLDADIITIGRTKASHTPTLDINLPDDALASALTNNIDCLIHLAAKAHSHQVSPEELDRDNRQLTERMARMAVAAGIPRIIYLSSIKVYGNSTSGRSPYSANESPRPEDDYGRSKLASEIALQQQLTGSHTSYVIIRPPLIYGRDNKGNLRSLSQAIKHGIPLPFARIQNRRDLVSVDNLCSLIATTITHPKATNNIFLVSDGVSRSTADIIKLLAQHEELPVRLIPAPYGLFRLGRILAPGLIDRLTGNLEVDITKTCDTLNWSPR